MKPVMQTIRTRENGNCFQACIASILEIPLEEVPHFCGDMNEKWWEDFVEWMVGNYDLCPVLIELDATGVMMPNVGYCIVSGEGGLGVLHSVVGKDGDIVFNPQGNDPIYELKNTKDFIVFVARDASKIQRMDPGVRIKTIHFAKDFTRTPGGRHKAGGPWSAEEFREKHLDPIFGDPFNADPVHIDLDGAFGYASSFLEEAFGGLVRQYGYDKVAPRITLKCKDEPRLIDRIQRFMRETA